MILQRELIILPQGMAFPVLGEQDAEQLRVVGEPDAREVEDFALVPVGGGPDRRDRRNLRQLARLIVLPARQDQLDREAVALREALKVIDDLRVRLEARLRDLLRVELEVV